MTRQTHTLGQRGILALSSAFGLGYIPKAPGTFGTLAALPLWWLLAPWGWQVFGLVTLGLIALAIGVAHAAEAIYGGHDSKKIVIDEVVGLLTGVVGVPFRWPEVLAAFVLFRFFDILKPWPIRWLDRNVGGGFGVVVDDVAAGIATLVLMYAAHAALGGWW